MNIYDDNEDFRTPEQPCFLSNKMMAEESLLELEDLSKLLSTMKKTGEIENPWYNDWFNSLSDIPRTEWFKELDLIIFMAKEEKYLKLDYNEREIERFKARQKRKSIIENNKRENIAYLSELKRLEADKNIKKNKVAFFIHCLVNVINPISNALLVLIAVSLLYSLVK